VTGAILLTRDEVSDLTGLKKKSAQVKWLRQNGIRHWIAADGHPRVPRSVIESSDRPATTRRAEPNLAALG